MNKFLSSVYSKAVKDGRVCLRCGWIVTKKDYAKEFRMCAGCRDALQGVNIRWGHSQEQQEVIDMTGEML